MNKHLPFFTLLLLLTSSAYAQMNLSCACPETELRQQQQNTVSPLNRNNSRAGITCDSNTFWCITSGYDVEQFQLIGNTVTSMGIIMTGLPGYSLAYCNNLNGGAFSPTFYSTNSGSGTQATYYDGVAWQTGAGISVGNANLPNAGGNGNYLYYQIFAGTSDLQRYNGATFTTIYSDPVLGWADADIAVDDSGNAWCLRGTLGVTAQYLDVISPTGVVLKRYNMNLPTNNAYGCFLLNGLLYIGMGAGNPTYPNSLVPFTITPDSAIQGTAISMPSASSYIDMASCTAGVPPFQQINFQVSVASTNANCINPCSGTANAVATGNPPYTFQWSNGANTAADSNLCVGTYYVTVTDSAGTSLTDSVVIIAPVAPIINLGNDTSVCLPDTLTLDATLSGASYLWNSGATTATINAFQTNEYFVTVTLGSCNSVDSIHITENPKPPASVTANQTVFCAGDSALICANSGMASYLWNTGDTSTCITTQLAGNYYVTLTDANGCSATSNHLAIAVHPSPPVSVSVNGDTLSSYNAVTYQWFLNGNLIPGATSQTYIATQGGSYNVAVTDTNGCAATSTAVVISGIAPLSLGEGSGVRTFPNPNSVGSWQLTVGNELIGSKVEIFDAEGRLVIQSEIGNPKSEIVLNVEGGIYLMRISSAGNVITRKLIKL